MEQKRCQERNGCSNENQRGCTFIFVRSLLFVGYIALIAFFSWMTYTNNPYWDGNKIFFRLLNVSPNSCKVHYFAASSYFELEQWNDTIRECKRAIEIEPDYCDVNYPLGVAYFKIGRKDKSLEHFEKALDCWPVFSDAFNTLYSVYRCCNPLSKFMAFY